MTFLEFIVTRVNDEQGLGEAVAGLCSSEKIMQVARHGKNR